MVDTKPISDHAKYLGMCRRVLRALARRVGDSDPEDLALMLQLRDTLDDTIAQAVQAQREAGFTWAQIAAPCGVTRQAAYQQWGKRIGAKRKP